MQLTFFSHIFIAVMTRPSNKPTSRGKPEHTGENATKAATKAATASPKEPPKPETPKNAPPKPTDTNDPSAETETPKNAPPKPTDTNNPSDETETPKNKPPKPTDTNNPSAETKTPKNEPPKPTDTNNPSAETKTPENKPPKPTDTNNSSADTETPGNESTKPTDTNNPSAETETTDNESTKPTDTNKPSAETETPRNESTKPTDTKDPPAKNKTPKKKPSKPTNTKDPPAKNKTPKKKPSKPTDTKDPPAENKIPKKKLFKPTDTKDPPAATKTTETSPPKSALPSKKPTPAKTTTTKKSAMKSNASNKNKPKKSAASAKVTPTKKPKAKETVRRVNIDVGDIEANEVTQLSDEEVDLNKNNDNNNNAINSENDPLELVKVLDVKDLVEPHLATTEDIEALYASYGKFAKQILEKFRFASIDNLTMQWCRMMQAADDSKMPASDPFDNGQPQDAIFRTNQGMLWAPLIIFKGFASESARWVTLGKHMITQQRKKSHIEWIGKNGKLPKQHCRAFWVVHANNIQVPPNFAKITKQEYVREKIKDVNTHYYVELKDFFINAFDKKIFKDHLDDLQSVELSLQRNESISIIGFQHGKGKTLKPNIIASVSYVSTAQGTFINWLAVSDKSAFGQYYGGNLPKVCFRGSGMARLLLIQIQLVASARNYPPHLYLQANPTEGAKLFYKHLGFEVKPYHPTEPVIPNNLASLTDRSNKANRFVDFKPFEQLASENTDNKFPMLEVLCTCNVLSPHGEARPQYSIYNQGYERDLAYAKFPFQAKKKYFNNLATYLSVLGLRTFDFFKMDKKTSSQAPRATRSTKPNTAVTDVNNTEDTLYVPSMGQVHLYLHNSVDNKLIHDLSMYPVVGKCSFSQYDEICFDTRGIPGSNLKPYLHMWLKADHMDVMLRWIRRNTTSELNMSTACMDPVITKELMRFVTFGENQKQTPTTWVHSMERSTLITNMSHIHNFLMLNKNLLACLRIFLIQNSKDANVTILEGYHYRTLHIVNPWVKVLEYAYKLAKDIDMDSDELPPLPDASKRVIHGHFGCGNTLLDIESKAVVWLLNLAYKYLEVELYFKRQKKGQEDYLDYTNHTPESYFWLGCTGPFGFPFGDNPTKDFPVLEYHYESTTIQRDGSNCGVCAVLDILMGTSVLGQASDILDHFDPSTFRYGEEHKLGWFADFSKYTSEEQKEFETTCLEYNRHANKGRSLNNIFDATLLDAVREDITLLFDGLRYIYLRTSHYGPIDGIPKDFVHHTKQTELFTQYFKKIIESRMNAFEAQTVHQKIQSLKENEYRKFIYSDAFPLNENVGGCTWSMPLKKHWPALFALQREPMEALTCYKSVPYQVLHWLVVHCHFSDEESYRFYETDLQQAKRFKEEKKQKEKGNNTSTFDTTKRIVTSYPITTNSILVWLGNQGGLQEITHIPTYDTMFALYTKEEYQQYLKEKKEKQQEKEQQQKEQEEEKLQEKQQQEKEQHEKQEQEKLQKQQTQTTENPNNEITGTSNQSDNNDNKHKEQNGDDLSDTSEDSQHEDESSDSDFDTNTNEPKQASRRQQHLPLHKKKKQAAKKSTSTSPAKQNNLTLGRRRRDDTNTNNETIDYAKLPKKAKRVLKQLEISTTEPGSSLRKYDDPDKELAKRQRVSYTEHPVFMYKPGTSWCDRDHYGYVKQLSEKREDLRKKHYERLRRKALDAKSQQNDVPNSQYFYEPDLDTRAEFVKNLDINFDESTMEDGTHYTATAYTDAETTTFSNLVNMCRGHYGDKDKTPYLNYNKEDYPPCRRELDKAIPEYERVMNVPTKKQLDKQLQFIRKNKWGQQTE